MTVDRLNRVAMKRTSLWSRSLDAIHQPRSRNSNQVDVVAVQRCEPSLRLAPFMKAPCSNRRQFLATAASAAAATMATACLPAAQRRAAAGVGAGASWIPQADLLGELPLLMQLANVPGLSMAVVEEGGVVWQRSFGVANATTAVPVSDSTLFEAASMSKPVFAYAVLQLADAQRLDLDRPLVSYYRPSYLPADPRIDRITARQVLSHTSGLPNWGDDSKPDTLRPAFEPGAQFQYSGEGYFWLQLAVEQLSGLGLDAFMRTTLFEPAGMDDSAFAWDDALLPRVAFGHREGRAVGAHGSRPVMDMIRPRAERWRKPIRDWQHTDWLRVAAELDPNNPARRVRFVNAAGSLLTTASDYARFMRLAFAHESRQHWELRSATRTAMLSPVIPVKPGTSLSWGMGWSLERTTNGWRCGHEGNNENLFTSYAGADPERGRALVLLTNAGSGFGLYQRVVRRVTGTDQLSFIAAI